jgi:hypothetical protein
MLTLTQGHLKLLETCPRRYQYTYLDHCTVPTDAAMLERQRWGTQFHQVMQQRDLGLPVEDLLRGEPALAAAVNGLLAAAPELFAPDFAGFRQSEHRCSLIFNHYSLTTIYDLLLLEPTQAQILDWKTYQRPPERTELAEDWQTRLYLYLLVETTDLAPEQVIMTYWFVAPPTASQTGPPRSTTLAYSTAQHQRTTADLQRLTDRLTELLTTPDDLPQVEPAAGHCDRCAFALRCQRSSDGYALAEAEALPAIADIAEIPL